jgi:sugar lactone lactonase YvrE
VIVLAACQGSGDAARTDGSVADAGACPAIGVGSLVVSVSGLPAGVNANIQVMPGTGGASSPVTATTTLPLPAGQYSIFADLAASPNPIVRTAYAPTVPNPSVCVSTTPTSVTVDYAVVPSSGKVWTSGGTGAPSSMVGFSPTSLAVTGSPSATVAANTRASKGFTFDRDGNLWAVGDSTADPPVARFSARTLGLSGAKTPDVVLNSAVFSGGIPGAAGLAFDAQGSLWVSIVYAGKVVKFPSILLFNSGAPSPSVEIAGIPGPGGMAFDAEGDLWIASIDNQTILKFSAARLAANTAEADLTLTVQTPPPVVGSLPGAIGLAFDTGGNLWGNFDGTLARLAPADLAGTGDKTVTPTVQITLSVTALPEGIAFDESGSLWLAGSAGQFLELTASQLAIPGAQTPSVVITSPEVSYAGFFALYPAPAGLPLYHGI